MVRKRGDGLMSLIENSVLALTVAPACFKPYYLT